MKTFVTRILATAFAVVMPYVASATTILPFGQLEKQPWTGRYFYALISAAEQAPANWYAADFDDSAWGTIEGPLSLPEKVDSYDKLPYYATVWNANKSNYWVRRHFTLDNLDKANYVFYVTHDDGCTAYLNGVQIYSQSNCVLSPNYKTIVLSGNALAALKTGDNVLAVYVSDSGGGMAFMDFGLYGYGDMEDIVTSPVPVTITNDEVYPWKVNAAELCNGNVGKSNSSSEIKFSYTADTMTEFSFEWYEYNYSNHQPLQVFVDGEFRGQTSSSSYSGYRVYVKPGTHEVAFRDSIGNSTSTSNNSKLKNIRIKELQPLGTAPLSEKSMPLTFDNDSRYPWIVADGCVQSSNYGITNSYSKFSTTFTIDKTSKLSFLRRVSGSSSYHNLYTTVNGVTYLQDNSNTSFERYAVALEPGTYTVEWKDTSTTSYSYFSQIKDVELSSDMITCRLEKARTLNVAALDQVETLDDVEMLKIVGSVGTDDWATIGYMRNLLAIDLSEAVLTEIPANTFRNNTKLSSAILPEGLTYIGDNAFRYTTLKQIKIPASVTSIGSYAFFDLPLAKVEFAENSKMNGFGYYTFACCRNLKSVILPNSMTFLGNYDFSECSNLQELWLPDAVTVLPAYLAYKADLRKLHLPKNLQTISRNAIDWNQHLERVEFPATLTSIGDYAFSGCYALDSVCLPLGLTSLGSCAFNDNWALTYLELPSYIASYNNNFPNCTSLKKVVCRSVTPPVVSSDPFQGCPAKSDITLVVPEFAMTAYGYDNYWQQFTTREAGAPVDYWMVNTKLTLEGNQRMEGKPDVDINYGGQFTVNGSAPLALGQLNLFVSEGNPCRLLNNCEAMGADSINTRFAVDANRWYFFTPLHDVDLTKVSLSNNPSFVFRYYDGQNRAVNGASGSWKTVDDGRLNAGQGYIFQCNNSSVITMPAMASGHAQVLTAYDVTMPLATYEAAKAANQSWNYVGNPYPAYYDIYYMDFTAPITVWNGSTYKAYSVVDDNYVLRPMQSFFVQKPDGVESILFHKEGRQLSSTVERSSARAAQQEGRRVFDLAIFAAGASGESRADEIRVVINEQASPDYEMSRDASKFLSLQADIPQLYTFDTQGNSYAINERPLLDGRVSLAYYAGQEGFYTIRLTRNGGEVLLYDALQDKTVDLSAAGEYTFHSDVTNGIDISRFTLTFKAGITTGVNQISNLRTQLSTLNSQPSTLYDLQGRQVDSRKSRKGIVVSGGRKQVNK